MSVAMECAHHFKRGVPEKTVDLFTLFMSARKSLENCADAEHMIPLGLCLLAQELVTEIPIGSLTVPAAVRSPLAARAFRKDRQN